MMVRREGKYLGTPYVLMNATGRPKTTTTSQKAPGKEYETIVPQIHRQFADGATAEENVKLVGKSGEERQIDVLLTGRVSVSPVMIIVDRKDYARRIGIQGVDE